MNLRELREFAGYSLAEAGRLVGISSVAVYKLEKSESTKSDKVKKLRDLYTDTVDKKISRYMETKEER